MIRRPPRSTQSRSSAASDVYKRQTFWSVARYSIQLSYGRIRFTAGIIVMGLPASVNKYTLLFRAVVPMGSDSPLSERLRLVQERFRFPVRFHRNRLDPLLLCRTVALPR